MGKPAYKVTGKLRTYAIIIQSAKVYDFDSKQYRCIVNSSHYQGAGYDDIATRLLALKNDSVTQDSIGTLRGAAQPQYDRLGDNANDSERDSVADTIERVISKAFSDLQPA
jgi:negative regulator of replication initiation